MVAGDDCPLAFYADDRIPGLIVVIWAEYANDYFHRASYFWLAPDGTVKAKPHGPFDVNRWEPNDPMSKFIDFEEFEPNASGALEGWLIVKTETRVALKDLAKERDNFA